MLSLPKNAALSMTLHSSSLRNQQSIKIAPDPLGQDQILTKPRDERKKKQQGEPRYFRMRDIDEKGYLLQGRLKDSQAPWYIKKKTS